jgi:hypothetical protein
MISRKGRRREEEGGICNGMERRLVFCRMDHARLRLRGVVLCTCQMGQPVVGEGGRRDEERGGERGRKRWGVRGRRLWRRRGEGVFKGEKVMAEARKRDGDWGRYEYGGGREREMRYDEQNRTEQRAEISMEQIEIKP